MKKIIKFLDNYGFWFVLILMLAIGIGFGLYQAKYFFDNAEGFGFIFGLKAFGKLTLILIVVAIVSGIIFRCWGFYFLAPTYILYFLAFLIYLFILTYNYNDKELFGTIITILVSIFTTTGLPIFIAFFLCAIIYNWDIETSKPNNSPRNKDMKIRTTHFIDEKGNANGTAVTYDYENHSETYIKDNLGNVEVESKRYDNYRETKQKK